jgi:hypothetical protein
MANPEYVEGALPRRKKPADALSGYDSAIPVQNIGIHNATAPSLVDGDVALPQLDDQGNLKVTLGDQAQVNSISSSLIKSRRFDYGTRDDMQPVWEGYAEPGSHEDEEVWTLVYNVYNVDGSIKESHVGFGSWTNKDADVVSATHLLNTDGNVLLNTDGEPLFNT